MIVRVGDGTEHVGQLLPRGVGSVQVDVHESVREVGGQDVEAREIGAPYL